jgi:diaminopimelate decarboxylase
MSAFEYQSGEFACEAVAVTDLAARFGTPFYVYSRSTILENFRRIRDAVASIAAAVCYSVKANSNLRILRLLHEAGAGFDIVSGGELARVLRAGAAPGRIVFSGVGKTQAEIDAGLAAGILMFNVESAGELEAIEARARSLDKVAGVAIRINPDVEAETHPYVSTGRTTHKFGVPKPEAISLAHRAARSRHLVLRGLACHIGSQILDVEPFLKAADEVLGLADRLGQEGVQLQFLDLGGGFGIPYTAEAEFDFARLASALKERFEPRPYRLIVEPGRAIIGDTAILVTRVLYVKRNGEKCFVVVDAGMNDLLRPALYGARHEIVPVAERPRATLPAAGTLRADVVGPLCETGDFLALDRDLPEVAPGDLLALLTAGAYGYVLASNYNTRPRPAEVLVEGDRAELIRRRETLDDLLGTETLDAGAPHAGREEPGSI